MSALVTGGHGFLGWHLRARLHAVYGTPSLAIGRDSAAALPRLLSEAAGQPVLYHCAAVNRAEDPGDEERANIELGRWVATAVRNAGRPVTVVYANSIQSRADTPYGRGKAAAADVVAGAVDAVGGSFADVLLPNLFGEHGRPDYNSFVATFAHRVAHGGTPRVEVDRDVPLLHVQRAAEALVAASVVGGRHEPEGEPRRVSEVLATLEGFHEKYRVGQIPALRSDLDVDLFNTYRSHLFPDFYPQRLTPHADDRGTLVETVRVHGSTGQTFISRTNPGYTRGEHYHLRKIERFCVVEGSATISLRRLLTDEVVSFQVNGDEPTFVDMPTLWVHNITNTGSSALITQFWTDQLLDPEAPDTYWESVGAVSEVVR